MTSITYITAPDLLNKLRSSSPPIVVDVRDEDRAGGHIKRSLHIPASDFKRAASSYFNVWRDKPEIVFHCMMSQMRGPSCARTLATIIDEAAKTEGEDTTHLPKISILEGGFRDFARHYSRENEDIFEDFDERLHGFGWERD